MTSPRLVPTLSPLVTRRQCLGALALPLLAPAVSIAAAATTVPANLWLQRFAGLDGPPVYWLTHATEYVVVDGASTPVKGRVGVLAALARQREDGTVRVSYLLQGCNVSATGFEFMPTLVHPITGETIPTAVGAPLRLGWNFGAGGQVTEDLVAANGTRAVYRGSTWESPGAGGARAATIALNIQLFRPAGAVESLTEVSVLRPRPSAGPADGFVPSESDTLTTREVLDKSKYKGTLVYSVSMGHGDSHRDVDDLQRAMRPEERVTLGTFFEQQERWAREA